MDVNAFYASAGSAVRLVATITNTGNLRLRGVTWTSPWGSPQPPHAPCMLQGPGFQPWVNGSDIDVGQWVMCSGLYTLTDDDLQGRASLSSGGAAQVQLVAAVQAAAGQALGQLSQAAVATFDVLAEPGMTLHMDATACSVGEL